MQSRFRNVLLAIAVLAAIASHPQSAHAQGPGAVTISLTSPTQFGGHVLAPGAYILRPASSGWLLTVEDQQTHRTIGFVRYDSVSEREFGDKAEVTTVPLDDNAQAKFAIISVYMPTASREYRFAQSQRPAQSQVAAVTQAGK